MASKYKTLTAKRLAGLPLGKTITESGIAATKTRDGDIRFTINVMVDGDHIHRTVGVQSEGVTRSDAERLIERLRTEAREGRLKLTKKRKLAFSFAAVATLYIARMEETGGSNLAQEAASENALVAVVWCDAIR